MEQYLPELLKQGTWAMVAAGLVLAIKLLRAEYAEREKTMRGIIDEQFKQYQLLQSENVATLKEDITLRAKLDARLEAIDAKLDKLQAQGG